MRNLDDHPQDEDMPAGGYFPREDPERPARSRAPGREPARYQGQDQVPVYVQQHLWRHSIESSALAGVALLLLAWLLPASVPLWGIVMVGAFLTAVTWYAALASTGSVQVSSYLGTWGAMITGWLAAARIIGAWHAPVIIALLLIVVTMAPLGAVAIGHHRDRIRRITESRNPDPKNTRELRYWERLLEELGVPGVTILDVMQHQAGKSVYGRMGKSTADRRVLTVEAVKGITTQIAVHKRLRADDVHVEQPAGGSSADFILHVRNRSTGPRETIYLPAENNPQTINRPIGLGVHDSGKEFRQLVREVAIIVIGVRGAGKSNLINVFIAQLAKCVDSLIFMIDLKGGRAARPWMMPWVKNFTRRPVIDWLATTREEALLMLDAVLAGGQARARSGVGGEKITPTADVPAMILICDETAVMTGHGIREGGISNYQLAQKLAQITETYRSEAIDPIVAALRGNVDIMGSTAVKAMSEVRIGLRVTQASDGDSVFPDDHKAAQALARLHDAGDGLVKTGPDISAPVHFYRMTAEIIERVALFAGDIRPAPEDRLVAAMGDAYEQRWTRPHGQQLLREWREQEGIPEPVDFGDEFGEIIAHMDDPEAEVDPRRKKLREILIRRGLQGYTVSQLGRRLADDGMTTPRETIHRWLVADEQGGYVRRSGGPHHRWSWVKAAGGGGDDFGGHD